jgi:hypothetical protein
VSSVRDAQIPDLRERPETAAGLISLPECANFSVCGLMAVISKTEKLFSWIIR